MIENGINNPDVYLITPKEDIQNPIVTLVIPAADEELTVGQFVNWCIIGFEKANIPGEILIVDSSKDKTAEIAVSKGARVLKTPKRGLGRAYIDAIPFIRGKYVIMGDADCTYDFRELKNFIEKLDAGYEFVMGSRIKGSIEQSAMPPLNQYFGILTTWILNKIYSTKFSDIHCGMRAITTDALKKMKLQSQSWQYASEMIIKSVHMNLKSSEVPVFFYKDINGRQSHLKRAGWHEVWYSGWISLKIMFIYGADFFLRTPGLLLTIIGLGFIIPLTFGPFSIGPVTFSLYWMLFWLAITIVGVQSLLMSILTEMMYDYSGKFSEKWVKIFDYNKVFVLCIILLAIGLLMTVPILEDYFKFGLSLPFGIINPYNSAVTGILCIIVAFQVFTSMLIIHALSIISDNSAKLWR